jgi:hypothetical protein
VKPFCLLWKDDLGLWKEGIRVRKDDEECISYGQCTIDHPDPEKRCCEPIFWPWWLEEEEKEFGE